jgi:hypothetical protein
MLRSREQEGGASIARRPRQRQIEDTKTHYSEMQQATFTPISAKRIKIGAR